MRSLPVGASRLRRAGASRESLRKRTAAIVERVVAVRAGVDRSGVDRGGVRQVAEGRSGVHAVVVQVRTMTANRSPNDTDQDVFTH